MPNDDYASDINTTGRLTISTPVTGVINYWGDQDWFKVYLTTGTTYAFNQIQTPINEIYNLDSYIRLLDGLGNAIPDAYDDDSGGYRNAQLIYTPSKSGYYYVSAEANSYTHFGNLTGSYQLSMMEINHAPVVIPKSVSVASQLVPLSSLFTVSDPDGNSIASYAIYDPVGVGYFSWSSWDGVTWDEASRILTVTSTAVQNVTYQSDSVGTEKIGITASDGYLWSNWANAQVTATQGNHAPVVTGKKITLSADQLGQSIPFTSLFTASDPDGNVITTYKFHAIEDLGQITYIAGLGITWDQATRVLTVPSSVIANVSYQLNGVSTVNLNVSASDGTVWSSSASTQIKVNAPTNPSYDIFWNKGDHVYLAGVVRVLADFSKAAYSLRYWENNAINDYMPNADAAKHDVLVEQWVPLDLNVPHIPTIVSGQTVENRMDGGFYIMENAAAFIARSGDALVISFRGTNDNAEQYSPNQNPNDIKNQIKPDVEQWGKPNDLNLQTMADHYKLFKDLLEALDQYVSIASNGIKQVYVTGHSLGGAMALEYMRTHKDGNVRYEAVTFAAPNFIRPLDFISTDTDYKDDNRIIQIEIDKDPVPFTWLNNDRPGKQIYFVGNNTSDTMDSYWPLGQFNTDNHSMDYYRQITKSVDASSWHSLYFDTKGDIKVLIGANSGPNIFTSPVRHDPIQIGDQFDSYFMVDGSVSGYAWNSSVNGFHFDTEATKALSKINVSAELYVGVDIPMAPVWSNDLLNAGQSQYNAYYGGRGDDIIVGNIGDELMLGGSGKDIINGNGGNDTFIGGAGDDTLDGGSGYDVAQFNGNLASYNVNRVGNAFAVRAKTGFEGTDTITNVESLKFADMTVNLTVQAIVAAVPAENVSRLMELYIAFFNRLPDADGLAYWIGQMTTGQKIAGLSASQSINQIAETFYSIGVQYSNLTGFSKTMSNADFINVIYKNVLGRNDGADTGGLTYWTEKLVDGSATRGSLVSTILDAAHGYKGDVKYGNVANLLDNKITVAKIFAIDWALSYVTANDSITHGMEIAAAVTATDTLAALALIGISSSDIHLG